jgi:hypothetical protein
MVDDPPMTFPRAHSIRRPAIVCCGSPSYLVSAFSISYCRKLGELAPERDALELELAETYSAT